MDTVAILLILLCLSPILIVVGIVVGAYYSRKNKRNKILKSLPADARIKAAVRINSNSYQHQWIKFVGFQASGILYIHQQKIIIEGYKKRTLEYDLRTCRLAWEGTDFMKSGLLQWFAIDDNQGNKYYLNMETGVLVLELGTKMTTQNLYQMLRQEQQTVMQTPPPIR